MAGDNDSFVGKSEHAAVKGVDDLLEVPAGEVGASDTALKERVSRDELLFRREIEANAALGVSRGVQYRCVQVSNLDYILVVDALVDLHRTGRTHADPGCLDIDHLQQRVVVLVQQNGRSR